jgi:DNA mismatch repair ATPase MutS
MMIMSSMRIKDNLEENVSTFHAELNKLRTIIAACNQQAPVFILLDEMLRGTNSRDRQIGSKALVRQLIRHRATALVATHDLELASLEEEFPDHITNYHFDVRIKNDELAFDYKIRTGVCTTFNATLLMRKIGIEM